MDNRSIFLCRVPTDGGTASEKCWQVIVVLSEQPRRKAVNTFVIQGDFHEPLGYIHRKDVQENLRRVNGNRDRTKTDTGRRDE